MEGWGRLSFFKCLKKIPVFYINYARLGTPFIRPFLIFYLSLRFVNFLVIAKGMGLYVQYTQHVLNNCLVCFVGYSLAARSALAYLFKIQATAGGI